MHPLFMGIVLIIALIVNSRQSYDYKDIVSLGLAIAVVYFILRLLGLI